MKKWVFFIILASMVAINFPVRAETGGVEITTIPTLECSVYLDNIGVGTTPLKLSNVGAGTHWLEVAYGDQVVFNNEIKIPKNRTIPVKIKIDLTLPKEEQEFQPIEFPTSAMLAPSSEALEARGAETRAVFVSAEPRVKKLIAKEISGRENSGNIVIGLGAAMSILGVSSGGRSSGAYVLTGLTYIGLGIWGKTWKSDFENDYDLLVFKNDQSLRAQLAGEALAKEADRRKRGRESSAWLPMFYGAMLTATGAGAILGIPMLVIGWNQYNEKTEQEKEYDAYLKEKEGNKGGVLRGFNFAFVRF